MSHTIRSADAVHAAILAALTAAGATSSDAEIQARMLVEAELRAHPSHGLRRVPVLVARLRAGLIVSGVEAEHEWRAPSVLRVDGRGGFGPVVAGAAVDAVVDRAATTGAAIAAIGNAHHLGMMAPYLERMTARGCVGLVVTTSEALVHPWGGNRALVGTNPIGIGVPHQGGPLILDMSTGATSAGRIRDYAARGRPIPPGWAVDARGEPTTDAAAAIDGAISPFGGAKGYALGIALESLVGVLTGTAFGTDVHGTLDAEHPVTKGDLIVAMDTAVFGGNVAEHLTAYLSEIRASARDDAASVDVPGDRARRERRRALRDGVAIDDRLWAQVQEMIGAGE